MQLTVPTFMCRAMIAMSTTVGLKPVTAGEIVEMPYGTAITLKAIGGVSALVEEEMTHLNAQEHLKVYGADGWFSQPQQTIARVADFLAEQGHQTTSIN